MGALEPPDFGRSVQPISTRGTDYAHLITTGTPGFSDLPTALRAENLRAQSLKIASAIFLVKSQVAIIRIIKSINDFFLFPF